MQHRRVGFLSLAAAGGLGAALLGSGLLAIASDSVTSNGNDIRSGTYAQPPPAGHDLRVARVPAGGACPAATDPAWTQGPITALVSGSSVDLNGSTGISQLDDLCVRNFGSSGGVLDVVFPPTSIVNSEETCEASEEAEVNDSCTSFNVGHDPGELEGALQVVLHRLGGTGCDNVVTTVPFASLRSPQTLVGTFATGVTCRFYLGVKVDQAAIPKQRIQAQTDKIQWDIVFSLHDSGGLE